MRTEYIIRRKTKAGETETYTYNRWKPGRVSIKDGALSLKDMALLLKAMGSLAVPYQANEYGHTVLSGLVLASDEYLVAVRFVKKPKRCYVVKIDFPDAPFVEGNPRCSWASSTPVYYTKAEADAIVASRIGGMHTGTVEKAR